MEMEDRLQRLEDDRAIRDLKASYLRAADTKDVEAMRACFTADAMIAFDGFPVFTDREAFLSVYRDMACAPGIFDIHHGANGGILIANSRPVNNAELSASVWPIFCLRRRSTRDSASQAASIATTS